jgi:hypothetical protein
MKILFSFCCVCFAMLLHPFVFPKESAQPGSGSDRAFRVIEIQKRENGYSNFETMAITSKDDFETLLREMTPQGWNSRQAFQDTLINANVDFNHEALILLRHDESSGSVQVTFEPPVVQGTTLLTEIRGQRLRGMGTADMAYYCFALAVSKSLVNEVKLKAGSGFPEVRQLPPIVLSVTERQPPKIVPAPTPRTIPENCPTIYIACPTQGPETGKTYTFSLNVQGEIIGRDLNYNWSVWNGEIVDGQGTRTIKVRVNGPKRPITATAQVGGIQPGCNAVVSCVFGPQ